MISTLIITVPMILIGYISLRIAYNNYKSTGGF